MLGQRRARTALRSSMDSITGAAARDCVTTGPTVGANESGAATRDSMLNADRRATTDALVRAERSASP